MTGAKIGRNRLGSSVSRVLLYFILAIGAVIMAFPIVWMISIAFESPSEIYSLDFNLLPKKIIFTNFAQGWVATKFSNYFLNSLVIASGAVLFSVIFNSMAGFALAKYRFKGKDLVFMLILSALMVPTQVKLVPLYLLVIKFHWVDTYVGAIVPTISQAFGVFLMRQYCLSIPTELIEAARVEGSTEARTFWRIVFPLCSPAIAVNVIFQFMWHWNDLLWPLIVIRSQKMYTIQQGLAFFREDPSVSGGPIMAMSLVSVLPIAIVFFALQKYFIAGIVTTGLK